MVRPRKVELSPTKETEIKQHLEILTEKFDNDLRALEMAKREYSTSFVESMSAEFQRLLSKDVLNMRLVDFIRRMEQEGEEESDEEMDQMPESSQAIGNNKTPTSAIPHPSYYKSLKMTDGLHLKIPSCITPRVNSSKPQKPRPSKFGEILFSVRGTPVMNMVTAANMLEAKKHDAIVQSLMHQEDALLTPETRKIIGKLKKLVHQRAEDVDNN